MPLGLQVIGKALDEAACFRVGGALDPETQTLAVADAGADGFMDVQWVRRAILEDPSYVSGTGPLEWSVGEPCPTCPNRDSLDDIAAGQWVDWNHDGNWSGAGEQIFTNRPVSAGANALSVQIPPSALGAP